MARCLVVVALIGCGYSHGTTMDASVDSGRRADGPTVDVSDIDMAPPKPIAYVQGGVLCNFGPRNEVAVTLGNPQAAGNFNVAVVSWSDGNDSVMSITDSQGNLYIAATAPLVTTSFTQRIYYATNIKPGSNTVRVVTTANVTDPKLRVFEYAGIATSAPTDGTAGQAGVGNVASVGPVATTFPRDLLFAANVVSAGAAAAGSGFTQRQLDDGDLVQDRVVATAGSYGATSPINATCNWSMQLVAFKGQ